MQACLLAVLCIACGGAHPRDKQAVQEELVSDPNDREARQALARILLEEGRRGQGLTAMLELEQVNWLPADLRVDLRTLLSERALERLALGDAEALLDARAAGLEALDEYEALTALAYLRHSSRFEQDKAASHLRALPASDPRRFALDSEELDDKGALKVFYWLANGGAKRQALRFAQLYVDRGGRDMQALQRWRDLHVWWFGSSRPALPGDAAALTLGPDRGIMSLVRALSTGPEVTPLGLAADWGVPAWQEELQAIARAHQRDPALATRLAHEFVGRAVYGARERAIVIELLFRLGNREAALAFAIELEQLSRHMPVYSLVAGLASAATGEVDAAELYFTQAAAASGDAGAYWALVARAYRGSGNHLATIAACKKALSLTAPGLDAGILLDLAHAQGALGRAADAKATRAALLKELPAEDHQRVAEILELDSQRKAPSSLLDPIQAALGFAP